MIFPAPKPESRVKHPKIPGRDTLIGSAEMPRENRDRQAKRAARGVRGKYHHWIRRQPCIIRGHPLHQCGGCRTAHHLDTVGSGGVDEGNEVPACELAHEEVQGNEAAFEARYGLDLRQAAKEYAAWYYLPCGFDGCKTAGACVWFYELDGGVSGLCRDCAPFAPELPYPVFWTFDGVLP